PHPPPPSPARGRGGATVSPAQFGENGVLTAAPSRKERSRAGSRTPPLPRAGEGGGGWGVEGGSTDDISGSSAQTARRWLATVRRPAALARRGETAGRRNTSRSASR